MPPEGGPSIADLNQRVLNAWNRLQIRGVVPQPNPLVTAWQLVALVELLSDAGVIDANSWMYRTVQKQVDDLERLVAEKPPSALVQATTTPKLGAPLKVSN